MHEYIENTFQNLISTFQNLISVIADFEGGFVIIIREKGGYI